MRGYDIIGVGYEGATVDEVVGDLVAAGVGVLVDVRLTPLSRKAGFSERALSQRLAAAGIEVEPAGLRGDRSHTLLRGRRCTLPPLARHQSGREARRCTRSASLRLLMPHTAQLSPWTRVDSWSYNFLYKRGKERL